MEEEIKLTISGLVYNQTVVGTYGLVLSEYTGNRRFSVMIGEPEAQSIALKLNNKKSPRPLTHDLIQSILNVFESKLERVLIYNMVNDVFYSELHIQSAEKKIVIDARTSDAVALAIRTEAPIFIKSNILDIVGTQIDNNDNVVEEESVDAESLSSEQLMNLAFEDLDELLKMAIHEEKYELAVRIRDAINNKQ